MSSQIDEFLVYIQSEDLAPGTLANYRINLRLFANWLMDQHKTINTLTPADMRQYREHLKSHYKPSTINRKLSYVSGLLRWCNKMGLISENPMTRTKWVKAENYPKWLTQEQVKMLLASLQEAIEKARAKKLGPTLTVAIRMQAIAIILLNTGLRVSELCDLRLSDIKDEVITVRWGKGEKRRKIPMNDQAKSAIEEWLKVRKSNSDYVFVTDGRMTRQLVQWHLSQLGKRLGFRLTPHLLRHTFGKSLADRQIPLDKIAKLMGHSNINTTAIYTMPSLEDLREAVKILYF